MKIACIVGARPNFIKIAPIMEELSRFPDRFAPVLIHTGQHYDPTLSDVFFHDLKIPAPDHFLGVGHGSQAQQTASIINAFDALCECIVFDRVLVVGDVTSTMACAITAAKRRIPVDHVEAGLRSFDRSMPEEVNRIITDSVSDLFFVTEESGVENLLHEGHVANRIFLVGNVMIDSLVSNLDAAIAREKWRSLGVQRKEFALVTLHRPSNVDPAEQLERILTHLDSIAKELPVIFPVHPRTRKNIGIRTGDMRVQMIDPVGYLDFVSLMEAARFVITDSGGIQEETTVLRIPCLTLRANTERPVTTQIGSNTLVGEDPENLEPLIAAILNGDYKRGQVPDRWDGGTSRRIVNCLRQTL